MSIRAELLPTVALDFDAVPYVSDAVGLLKIVCSEGGALEGLLIAVATGESETDAPESSIIGRALLTALGGGLLL